MMSLWDALRMNMMISYQELVRTFPNFSDSEEELKKMLSHYFKNIDVIVKGAVAMFSAHGKK